MSTPFDKIYDKFFLQIGNDAKLELLKLIPLELDELLYSMLEESVVSFKKCTKKLEQNMDTELKVFNTELDLDLEEISILALGVVLVWLRPQVMRLQNLKQSLGDRDFKLSSNWQTLNSLSTLKNGTQSELKQRISEYTYNVISDIKVKR